MKVLHVINSLNGGGAEKLLTQLLPKLGERGVEAEVLSLAGSGNELAAILERNGIPVRYSRWKSLYSPAQVLAIRKHLRSFQIIHAHLFPAFLWAAMAMQLLPGKTGIYTEHSTTNRRRRHGLLKLVDSWAYSRYSRIVCISQAVKQSLAGHLRRIEGKAVVIHNGIDLDRFSAGSEEGPASEQGRVVVCVANLLPYKGQEVLIRATPLLPGDVRVALAGRGPLEQRLRALARELGVQERVRFLGYVEDIASIFRTARVCAIPSQWEGFGLAAVEAMASGVPVVASRVPGLAEVVGQAGLLFESGSASDLAEKISALLGSGGLWAEKRRKGLERSKEFSIDRMVEEHRRLYVAALGAAS